MEMLCFQNEEQAYVFFEKNSVCLEDAIDILIKDNTVCSMYVLLQIFGNGEIYKRFGWREPIEDDIKKLCRSYKEDVHLNVIYPHLFSAKRNGAVLMQKIAGIPIKDISYRQFGESFSMYVQKARTIKKRKTSTKRSTKSRAAKKQTNVYAYKVSGNDRASGFEGYEYGLSDW